MKTREILTKQERKLLFQNEKIPSNLFGRKLKFEIFHSLSFVVACFPAEYSLCVYRHTFVEDVESVFPLEIIMNQFNIDDN